MKILHYKPTMCLEEGGVVNAVLNHLCIMLEAQCELGRATLKKPGAFIADLSKATPIFSRGNL